LSGKLPEIESGQIRLNAYTSAHQFTLASSFSRRSQGHLALNRSSGVGATQGSYSNAPSIDRLRLTDATLQLLSWAWQPHVTLTQIKPGGISERSPFFDRVMTVVEWAAIVAFCIATLIVIPDSVQAARQHGISATWLISLIPLAHVCADLFTGFMHFFADNFCSDNTPILGPAFVRRFREHHFDQTAICRLSFRELNGGLVLVSLPIFVPIALWNDESASHAAMGLTLFAWSFLFFGTTTNQVHRWAHERDAPRLAIWLASHHLILNRKHHAYHHAAPHDSHFCITHGWLNPLLDRSGFWHSLARFFAAIGVPQFSESAMGAKRQLLRAKKDAGGVPITS
jgi:hypothetical protein